MELDINLGSNVLERRDSVKFYRTEYHIFPYRTGWILYDIWQGVFCEIDELTKAILDDDDGKSPEEIAATLATQFQRSEVLESCFELQKAGFFSTEPRELRPFVPPSRLEIVHLGLDLSGSAREVPFQAIDLLMLESGLYRQCYITLQGAELLRKPEFARRIVDYGLKQALHFEKDVFFEVIDSTGKFDRTTFDGLDRSRVRIICPLDDSPECDLSSTVEIGSDNSCERQPSLDHETFGTAIRCTVDRSNLDLTDRIRRAVERHPDARTVVFNFQALPPQVPDALTSADLPKALVALEELVEYVKRNLSKSDAIWIGEFEDCVMQVFNRWNSLYHCGAGTRFVFVTPEGEIYVCPGLVGHDAFCLGSVQEGINRKRQRLWIRSTHAEQFDECKKCWARYLCGGGCRLNAFRSTGDVRTPDPVICDVIRRTYELALVYCVDLHETALERFNARYAQGGSNEHPVF
ncbi:MAG: SPASM domain-containing protein [Gemmatimonadota bacterium]|nr:SPASM domain-containing protein [Gemmatimonadota bacterium]